MRVGTNLKNELEEEGILFGSWTKRFEERDFGNILKYRCYQRTIRIEEENLLNYAKRKETLVIHRGRITIRRVSNHSIQPAFACVRASFPFPNPIFPSHGTILLAAACSRVYTRRVSWKSELASRRNPRCTRKSKHQVAEAR